MADRYPLIYNPSANQIQELQSGDSLDVGNSAVKGATGYATTTGTSSQFLKADGSLDGTTYLTSSGTAQLAQGLTGTPTIDVGDVTGVNATFSGNLTVNGTTTTLDTNLTEVDKLEIAANNNNVAVAITQSGAGKAMTVEGGDVGIGTDNPVERLHVAKNSATGPSFYITNDSTGHTNADGLQIGFDGSNNARIRNRENTELKLYTNNTPRLTVTNTGDLTVNGSVGIGTTNTLTTKLHVQGTGNGSSGSSSLSDSSEASAVLLKPLPASGTAMALGARGSGGHYIQGLYAASSVTTLRDISINPYGGSVGIGTLSDNFAAGASATSTVKIATTGVERLRITGGGDVLIGGHSARTYDDTGDTNVILDVYGGSTSGKRGILSLSGRTNGDVGDLGTIWFNNNDNSAAGVGTQMKLSAAMQAKSVTSDSNADNDAGANLRFYTKPEGGNLAERLHITSAGHILPGADNTQDLGSSSARFANIYTGDLNLSNEGSSNDVDGTWGQYTIQEGEDDLFLINRRTGKKYKFNLTEVD